MKIITLLALGGLFSALTLLSRNVEEKPSLPIDEDFEESPSPPQ